MTRALHLAVLIFIAYLFASLAGAAPASAAQIGAVGDITWGQPRPNVDREIDLLRANGVHWVRANINWKGLEPDRKGEINPSQLSEYDYAIDRARAAGLEVLLPISDGVPYWASGDPSKHVDAGGNRQWRDTYAPANMADYGDIVRFVVNHFKTRGVHAYEIWNEPNLDRFWASGPDPAAYVRMLKAAYPAAKAADPSSTVLLGGLSKSDFAYLEGVYLAGGGGYFDAVAVHPYTYGVAPPASWNGVNAGEDPRRISKNAFPAIQEIKHTMDAHGDAAKQVWITEFGYSTYSGDGGVSEAQQAAYLTSAFRYVERFSWVHSIFWYAARNGDDSNNYESQFGLTTADWRPKASLAALSTYARGQGASGPSPAGPAAIPSRVDAAPASSVALPTPHVTTTTAPVSSPRKQPVRRTRRKHARVSVHGRLPMRLTRRGHVKLSFLRVPTGAGRIYRKSVVVRGGRYDLRIGPGLLAPGRWAVGVTVIDGHGRTVRASKYRNFQV